MTSFSYLGASMTGSSRRGFIPAIPDHTHDLPRVFGVAQIRSEEDFRCSVCRDRGLTLSKDYCADTLCVG